VAKELNITLGEVGKTVLARLYLNGVLTGSDVSCTEVTGAGGLYCGDMPAIAAGLYDVVFFADARLRGSGEIEWDGSAEILIGSRLATTGYTAPDNTNIATAAAAATAIKEKTDSLTFSAAGRVDSNVKNVNDVAITGAGKVGDTWRPA
jgi:hypothetical protein